MKRMPLPPLPASNTGPTRKTAPVRARMTLMAAAILLFGTACQRDASTDAESAGATSTPVGADDSTQVDQDSVAYYEALAERHDGGYAACGESVQQAPQACDAVGDVAGAGQTAPGRVLLMLDASGSMAARIGGERMLTIAQDALLDFGRRLPEQANVGFRVYGHSGNNRESGKAESCAGTELRYAFAPFDETRFEQAVRSFEPVGWTPIAASLDAAAADFAAAGAGDAAGNVIYMVSDGIETCGGDPVAAARRLQAADVNVVVNVIGFGVGSDEARQLRAIAEAGGGEYLSATNRADLYRIFNARSQQAYARFNCVSREQHTAFNTTSRAQHDRFNCLSRRAHGEFNNVSREVHNDFNAGRATREQRDYALAQARRKRDDILDPARTERDAVLDAARTQRDRTLSEERRARDDRLDDARRDRDEGLQQR
ncbi:hypothetical protein E2F46_13400 [Luteimonas aestuarii]|uniref:VWFA domain-containing protein n=1 Tax=Luteimonas aestuarii TaxID=453837 RepID=A0A4R5TRE6_9GAMM|nr:VWA domain-containing protein [Luteimonas aestuarii]TDK22747.1 hypothetical protein E2F46_13400 [Luteimonas aestuarii]